jgi:hypothetical protein
VGPFRTPWSTFAAWIVVGGSALLALVWATIDPMGVAAALVWMGLGSPFGLHGFIPGVVVGLLLLVAVSLFTERPPRDHLAPLDTDRGLSRLRGTETLCPTATGVLAAAAGAR